MSLNSTPSGERIHIGFFGKRNAGKSSLVNAITNQQMAVVSKHAGTTTDPVYKAMELLPLGPVMIVDTPGFDDEGELGQKRVAKTKEILDKTDIAVLAVDSREGVSECDSQLIRIFEEKSIPYIVVYTKKDLATDFCDENIYLSSKTNEGIETLKNIIAKKIKTEEYSKPIVSDLMEPLDVVVLVIPIDSSAPKGRLILPQQQVIRELLEHGAITVSVKETELRETLEKFKNEVCLVITDSQVFDRVSAIVPDNILLTSFSILMARHKGFLDTAVAGINCIDELKDGDKILITEGCTHHRQCEDIGTIKIPAWIKKYNNKNVEFEFTSGRSFPEDLTKYAMVIHCGGCMLNSREVINRMNKALAQNIPFTNYGIAIAKMKGILDRSIAIFKENHK